MNDIGRFILDCIDWALFFEPRYRALNTIADKNYGLIKSTIGKMIILIIALPFAILAGEFLRKLDERKKKKNKRNRQYNFSACISHITHSFFCFLTLYQTSVSFL